MGPSKATWKKTSFAYKEVRISTFIFIPCGEGETKILCRCCNSPRCVVTELKTLIFWSNSLLWHTVWMKTKEFINSATRNDIIYLWLWIAHEEVRHEHDCYLATSEELLPSQLLPFHLCEFPEREEQRVIYLRAQMNNIKPYFQNTC